MELEKFEYDKYDVIFPRTYFQFLKEVFVLDVYRAGLIRRNDVVLDMGACTGDFCIVASKKVGAKGSVIALEPDPDNYELLKFNIQRNKCQNVMPLNIGVGKEDNQDTEITAPFDKPSRGKLSTLETILEKAGMSKKLDFIKMDIEGAEVDVITKSINTIKQAEVVSLEFHDTKGRIDHLLLQHDFYFKPITMSYIYKRIIKNLLFHPLTLWNVYTDSVLSNPRIIQKAISGFDMTKQRLLVGSYIKGKGIHNLAR
jgi:FkbM family methyltransferase